MIETVPASPATDAPDAAFVERFRESLAALRPGDGKIGLGVSGGADSLSMLLLAESAMPGRFEVATVDHGLRPEAAQECAAVVRLCASRGIPCAMLPVRVEPGNVQASARTARYQALARWAKERELAAIATAHQADDQVETFLMRLARGSGVAGLASIRAKGWVPDTDMPLLRPMLAFSRAECEAIVAAAGLEPVQDPSNEDDRYDRVRLRKLLAVTPLVSREGLLASASHCAEADDALRWAAAHEWDAHVEMIGDELRYRRKAPRAIALRIVEWAIAALGRQPRGSAAAQLLDRLEAGQGGNAGGVLVRCEDDDLWTFTREPPRSADRERG